jgi:hypothetical protein
MDHTVVTDLMTDVKTRLPESTGQENMAVKYPLLSGSWVRVHVSCSNRRFLTMYVCHLCVH